MGMARIGLGESAGALLRAAAPSPSRYCKRASGLRRVSAGHRRKTWFDGLISYDATVDELFRRATLRTMSD